MIGRPVVSVALVPNNNNNNPPPYIPNPMAINTNVIRDYECIICQNLSENPCVHKEDTSCKVMFCSSCLLDYQNQNNSECPARCGLPFNRSQLRYTGPISFNAFRKKMVQCPDQKCNQIMTVRKYKIHVQRKHQASWI
ncbi:V(D)J recombination-activating protein 1-like [Panonychus citri]|uniref:V(D)J recombination-activating protein 1-like n=1 Tax=Panonychus citri TaxID=50023 RepID=UPI002307B1F2|nr:V(D)J recombination-activating protein 1-like [Panonychus citri]